MSCYFIAQIRFHDRDEYAKYLDKADEIFSKYNGKYLAVDNEPKVVEGKWNYDRLVLIEFPGMHDLKKWYDSEEYQNILKHRLKAATCDTVIVQGLNSNDNGSHNE